VTGRAARQRPGDKVVASAVPDSGRELIGVIADTHGRLDPSVLTAFAGVTHIIHAGDIGKRSVLRKLEAVAPVTAVSGNTDVGKLAKELPAQTEGEAAGIRFLVVHKPKQLRRLLRRGVPQGVRLVVTGHLHEAQVGWEDGVLYLNPGTASAPEEGDPAPTVAVVAVTGGLLTATFVPVGPGAGEVASGAAGEVGGGAAGDVASGGDAEHASSLAATDALQPIAASAPQPAATGVPQPTAASAPPSPAQVGLPQAIATQPPQPAEPASPESPQNPTSERA